MERLHQKAALTDNRCVVMWQEKDGGPEALFEVFETKMGEGTDEGKVIFLDDKGAASLDSPEGAFCWMKGSIKVSGCVNTAHPPKFMQHVCTFEEARDTYSSVFAAIYALGAEILGSAAEFSAPTGATVEPAPSLLEV